MGIGKDVPNHVGCFVCVLLKRMFRAVTYVFRHCSCDVIRQMRQYFNYYFSAGWLSELYFCCSSIEFPDSVNFITWHSWLDWKAFEKNLLISQKPCVSRYPDYLKSQRAPQRKSRWILQSALGITRLKHSWEFPGFAVNFILAGRFAGNASS